jgi:hypothetical protein
LSGILGDFVLYRRAQVLIVWDLLFVVFGGLYWFILAFHRYGLTMGFWIDDCDKVQQSNSLVVMLELWLEEVVSFDRLNKSKILWY